MQSEAASAAKGRDLYTPGGTTEVVPFKNNHSNQIRATLLRRKVKHGLLPKRLSRLQRRRRKRGVIGRVREVLGLQAEPISALVNVALFAGDGTVEEIPRIELNPGLGGGN